VNVLTAILWKDLVTEWRSRDRLVAMLLFSLLVVVVLHFAVPAESGSAARPDAAGLLWVAFIFAALLGLNRAFAQELENDALSALALAPADRGWVFLGKASASFLLLGFVQAVTVLVFALAFDLDLVGLAPELAGLIALGSLGLCAVGTLCSAMAVRTRFGEVLLPILLLPALFPVLAGAVRGTTALLQGRAIPFEALQLLIVVDAIYLIISFIGFDYVLDE